MAFATIEVKGRTITWAYLVQGDNDWIQLGDPWPCLNPPRKQLEEAISVLEGGKP
jgi:hypothetical protein